ncbi:MAG: hypothetical protein HZA53_17330 [Planctomycetes bacterium]|nr:hypothetical protein [Planctomycetota bacterium]
MGLFDFLLPKERRVERLWNRAMAELESYDFDAALKTAGELERLRFSGSFEVEARALAGLERGEEAVAAVERGLAKVPENGRLWEQLGIQCSDLGRFDRAHEAFAKARACADAPELASIALNDALVWSRQGEPARAESTLASAPATRDVELASRIEALRAKSTLELGRAKEALARVDQWLASPAADDASIDSRTRALLLATRATALHATDIALELVYRAIDAALASDKSVPEAARLLRTLDGRRSAGARRWTLTLEGLWPAPSELVPRPRGIETIEAPLAFFATYVVIADSSEDALELCRRFEPPHVGRSLRVESSTDLGAAPNELLGVERALGGYTFMRLRSDP